jgi:hypothetical protein
MYSKGYAVLILVLLDSPVYDLSITADEVLFIEEYFGV